jgi:hypothetical protein
VQKVLDAARIIESNAVRQGQIGLGDDRATAETLAGLVNLICEKMIMEPRHLQAVYTKWRLLDVADKSPLRGRLWGSAGLCARFTRKYFKTYSARSDAALAFRFDRTPTRLLLVALCGRWLFELLDELS